MTFTEHTKNNRMSTGWLVLALFRDPRTDGTCHIAASKGSHLVRLGVILAHLIATVRIFLLKRICKEASFTHLLVHPAQEMSKNT